MRNKKLEAWMNNVDKLVETRLETIVKEYNEKTKYYAKKAIRERDKLWCRALIHELDTDDIERVTGYFNKIRPD